MKAAQPIQTLGFYLSGFLCLVLAVLKLTTALHWSWWRVMLPVLVVLGHNVLYITVGFVWLFFADDGSTEDVALRDDDHLYGYQLAAMLCVLVFAYNVLEHIEADPTTAWSSPARWTLIFVSGVLSTMFQFLFWRKVVPTDDHRTRKN